MASSGVKIHETKRNTYISMTIAVICLIVGFQYIGAADTRLMGAISVVFGVLMAIAAIYLSITPMIILGDDSIYFHSGPAAKKEVPYSEIESWTLQGDKHLILTLKSDKEETDEEKKKNAIVINYRNIDKNNRQILTERLNKKGIKQIITAEPKKK